MVMKMAIDVVYYFIHHMSFNILSKHDFSYRANAHMYVLTLSNDSNFFFRFPSFCLSQ